MTTKQELERALHELLVRYFSKYNNAQITPAGLSLYLGDELHGIQRMQSNLHTMQFRLQEEQDRHAANVAGIQSGIREIQNACPHLVTTCTPDPSGGTDSSNVCEICGKEL